MKLPIVFAGLILASATPAAAQERMFDKPIAIQRMTAKSDNAPRGAQTCTSYPDLMLREDGSDTPAPAPAILIPIRPGGTKPVCTSDPAPGQIVLDTDAMALIGRKGNFLLFALVDTNGFMPFRVLDAASGQMIFHDSMAITKGVQAVSLNGTSLRLRYRRAVDAPCGLPKGGDSCWASILHDFSVPPEIARLGPPSCVPAYRKDKAPDDDPSIISYDVTLTLARDGKAAIAAQGPVGCAPMP
jgi:hypothetical protein